MRGLSFWFALPLAAICGCGPEPAPKTSDQPKADEHEPQSAEWLYVTDGVPGGRKGECQAVPARIAEEHTRCKGAFCSHGAALAKDWLGSCKSVTPELVTEIEQHADALAKKAKTPANPCEEEAEHVLREGACSDKECTSFAGSWGTRCAEWSTPLVIKMLEVTIERRTGNRVHIDARDCNDLLAGFAKGVDCDQQFKCQDIFPAIDAYRGHCLGPGKLPTLSVAITELSIRVGAAQNPEPIAVPTPSGESSVPSSLVPLEDGKGSVLFVCGKRVKNLAAYLTARKGCEEDVVIAHTFDAKDGSSARVGRLAHPNDVGFSRRFPLLAAKGEPEARYDAALPAFGSAVDQAAHRASDPKQIADATRMLAAAIAANADAVRNSRVFDAALRQRDAALVPFFRALGEAKKKAIHADLDDRKFAPALHRAENFPLADVSADGHVKLGESPPASAIEIFDMLPQSMAAYRAALETRFKRLAKIKVGERELGRLSTEADGHASRCAKAESSAVNAEHTLIACGFGLEKCDEARTKSLAGELDQARKDSEVHYSSTVLAIASLAEEQRSNAWQAAKLAGCREPWW